MNVIDLIVLFGILVALAAIPSASVIIVVARSAAFGFANGAVTAAGIVAGDLLFVVLAISGLSSIAEAMGDLFVIVKYLGGCYLIWFGLSILCLKRQTAHVRQVESSLFGGFLSGLLTLGDLKAVFFYASLFPTFVEVGQLDLTEIAVLALVTATTVGAVKLTYAYAAHKALFFAKYRRYQGAARIVTGSLVVGTGVAVVTKA